MSAADQVFLAVDLGASSGRVLAASVGDQGLKLEEAHRFENGGVRFADALVWDVLSLWKELQNGLRAAAAKHGDRVVSVGVDTWGVDYALLGKNDELLGNPHHYRDARTHGALAKAFAQVSREEIFAHTGLQFLEINTLYQLLAARWAGSSQLAAAERFLMIPDLFHWLLTGEKSNEATDASTTQCHNPTTRDWAFPLLEKFGLPTRIFGPLSPPGTVLGPLRKSVAEDTGLRAARVVLPAAHDTASAVLAVPTSSPPAARPDWCYISSGTWSLMGVETPEPVINEACRRLNFTNEGGVGGTTRLLKNIAGLWLVQECRRAWKRAGREFGWEELTRRAEQSTPLVSLIHPDAAAFSAPRDMPAAIAEFCRKTGQPAPASEGAFVRCALESLALRYRQVLGWLEQLTGGRIDTIHIVGGGVQNRLLSQMAADACRRRVVTGPVEATAIGNVLMQAVAAGAAKSVGEARALVRRSFEVTEFTPRHCDPWDHAMPRFEALAAG